MIITKLKLKNFRNYNDNSFVFGKNTNIILGKNAQGKTNLLESIYICALGKSVRAHKDSDLIKWNCENSKIDLDLEKSTGKSKIEIYFLKNKKKSIKINNIPIKKIGELLGELRCVFFSPDELKLIKESPEDRRRFMDIDLSQTSKIYFNYLNKYEKLLNSRNKLLKKFKEVNTKKIFNETSTTEDIKRMVSVYDSQISECSAQIFISRYSFINALKPYATKVHAFLTNNTENLEIDYQGSLNNQINLEDKKNIKEKFLNLYKKNFEKDILLGYTTVGPHRDDIKVSINSIDVKNFCSQGQQRTAALSLKLAELEIIKQQTGEYPILILDDVLSELDENRRNKLIQFCSKTQTFISSTDLPKGLKNINIIRILNGKTI